MRALPLALVLLSACAGPVDPRFEGTWIGTSNVEFSDPGPYSYAARIEAHLSGEGAVLEHVCPAGDGAITVLDDNGSPGTAAWKGSLVCAPVVLADCAAVQFTYSLAWANLTERMAIRFSGDMDGCGQTVALSMLFQGSK